MKKAVFLFFLLTSCLFGFAQSKKNTEVVASIEKLRLTVNRQNFKSINFYFKNGFKIDHVEDFDIGNGYVMNDFVMLWENKKY